MQARAFQFADEARTVCIIAGGPSVTQAAANQTCGWPTIVVNNAWMLRPDAECLYACDVRWWDRYIAAVRSGFTGQLWTQDAKAAQNHGLARVVGEHNRGLGRKPGVIYFGQNGGYQAINLAWHWGARRFVLLGFDCRAERGKTHWFGDHPKNLNMSQPYAAWIRNFNALAADLKQEGCTVINCSLGSALTCWPKISVEQALDARLLLDSHAA